MAVNSHHQVAPKFFTFLNWNCLHHTLTPHLPSPLLPRPPPSSPWHLPVYFLTLILTILGTSYKWNQTVFVRTYCISVQFSHSVMSDSVIPWTAARQASLSITKYWSLLKLMSIESLMPSNHLILFRPLFLLPSVFPSIRVFSSETVLPIGWPRYWSFSFSVNSSNEYSGLSSFRMDWFDFLAIQWTL